MNTPTSKEAANLQKLIELTPIASGFDFLTKDNVSKVLVYFGDKYMVVGATREDSKASVLIKRIQSGLVFKIRADAWLNAAMREQLYFQ